MGPRVHPVVWGTVLLLVLIELILEAGDAGLLPPLRRASRRTSRSRRPARCPCFWAA
jgi:hypothetical protein